MLMYLNQIIKGAPKANIFVLFLGYFCCKKFKLNASILKLLKNLNAIKVNTSLYMFKGMFIFDFKFEYDLNIGVLDLCI